MVLAAALVAGLLVTQQPLSDAEKAQTWIGERVVLIGEGKGSPFKEIAGGLPGCFRPKLKPQERLPNAEYAGKAGTITALGDKSPFGNDGRYLEIRLDGTQEIVEACSESSLGFFTEREAVERLVAPLHGKPVWVRGGELILYAPDGDPRKGIGQIIVSNLARVQFSRVDWGHPFGPITVYWRLDDGREGGMSSVGDPRFHRLSTSGGERAVWKPTDDFFLEEPRKAHPKWSAAIWDLVAKGRIAVGMTEDIIDAACRRKLRYRDPFISVEAGSTGAIMSCGYDEFLVENGRVTRFTK